MSLIFHPTFSRVFFIISKIRAVCFSIPSSSSPLWGSIPMYQESSIVYLWSWTIACESGKLPDEGMIFFIKSHLGKKQELRVKNYSWWSLCIFWNSSSSFMYSGRIVLCISLAPVSKKFGKIPCTKAIIPVFMDFQAKNNASFWCCLWLTQCQSRCVSNIIF